MMSMHQKQLLLCAVLCVLSAACGGQEDASGLPPNQTIAPPPEGAAQALLRQRINQLQITPLTPPERPTEAKVALGKMLFADPILSGNKDAACLTCHRPEAGTADGLALPAGTSAVTDTFGGRTPGPKKEFLPRHVPDLFNRALPEIKTLFWDGRIARRDDGRFVIFDRGYGHTPNNILRELPAELDNLLAAQNLFPVLNRDELRGHPTDRTIFGEVNEVALVQDGHLEGAWDAYMARLMSFEGYRELFAAAYPDVAQGQLKFFHAANAISAFFNASFTSLNSPYDKFIAGDDSALSDAAARGGALFYGKARCSSCHSGALMSDQDFHNIGIRPMTSGPDRLQSVDFGAQHHTGAGADKRFAFRTPMLRNVTLTAPYMHNGAYNTLEEVIRHKMDARMGLWDYNADILRPEFKVQVHHSPELLMQVEETLSPLLSEKIPLTDDEVSDLIAFLESLTDPNMRDLRAVMVPESVPSGLEIPLPAQPRPVAPTP